MKRFKSSEDKILLVNRENVKKILPHDC